MRKIALILLLAAVHVVSAQEFAVKKGVVVDSLKISDSLSDTYALYLPQTFEGKRPWPVLLIFDPHGRGRAAANLFRTAAEEQGYILVSSNEVSSDTTLVANAEAGARLLSHVAGSFPVDFKQISTAGSLAGAKVATSLPVIFDSLHGTIAAGDHWINFDLLDRNNHFTFIALAGDEQFSGQQAVWTAESLQELGNFSAVYTYEGQEEWPHPELISSALGSLSIQAMREKLRPVDLQLIESLFYKDLGRADELISGGDFVEAHQLLELMMEKYRGLIELSPVEDRIDQVERSRTFGEQREEQQEIAGKQNRLVNDFAYYFEQDVKNAHFENLGWWNFQKLRLDSIAATGGAEAKMASRLKGFISGMTAEKIKELEEKNFPLEPRLFTYMLRTIFEPEDYDTYKKIISLSAVDNDFETALFYLEEMLKHGYRDKEALYNIPKTLGLRLTRDYNKIIENYLGSSKFYSDEQ